MPYRAGCLVLRPIHKIHKTGPAVLEHGGDSHRVVRRQPRPVRPSPPHGPVHRKKGQVSGYERPVSWIYILSHFDGAERWVSFWFFLGARLSRERFFDMIPGSADLIPDLF
jgi:hypothetical protein